MTDAGVPSGWYPDPAGAAATQRWWDGSAWSMRTRPVPTDGATRPEPDADTGSTGADPSAAADVTAARTAATPTRASAALPTPRADTRVEEGAATTRSPWLFPVALVAVVATVAAAGTWAVLEWRADDLQDVAATAPVDAVEPAVEPAGDAVEAASDAEDVDDPSDGVTGATAEPGDDPDGDGDVLPGDGAPTDAGHDTLDVDAEAEGPFADQPLTVVELDGECEVTLTADELERSDEIRPWFYPECAAPVVLDPGERQWIVVLASLHGADFTQEDAWDRAWDLGGAVLWSSHYPSLNPELWVVFRGPYATEQEAAAAVGAAGGAYPRELSDDEGDRYCLAADGCIGERRD